MNFLTFLAISLCFIGAVLLFLVFTKSSDKNDDTFDEEDSLENAQEMSFWEEVFLLEIERGSPPSDARTAANLFVGWRRDAYTHLINVPRSEKVE